MSRITVWTHRFHRDLRFDTLLLVRYLTFLLGGLLLIGCTEKLETGYKPRALKDNAIMRRSYYASPFSPESHVPKQDKDAEIESRRPRPGY